MDDEPAVAEPSPIPRLIITADGDAEPEPPQHVAQHAVITSDDVMEKEGRMKEMAHLAEKNMNIMKYWRLQAAVQARMEQLLQHAERKLREREDGKDVLDLTQEYVNSLEAKLDAIRQGLQMHLDDTNLALNSEVVKDALSFVSTGEDLGPRSLDIEFAESIDDPVLLALFDQLATSAAEFPKVRGLCTATPQQEKVLSLHTAGTDVGFSACDDDGPLPPDEMLQRIEYQSEMFEKNYVTAIAEIEGAQAKLRQVTSKEYGQFLLQVLQAVTPRPHDVPPTLIVKKWRLPDPKDEEAVDDWLDIWLHCVPQRATPEHAEPAAHRFTPEESRVARLLELLDFFKEAMDQRDSHIEELEEDLKQARQLTNFISPMRNQELSNEIAKSVRLQKKVDSMEASVIEAQDTMKQKQKELDALQMINMSLQMEVDNLTAELEQLKVELEEVKKERDQKAAADEQALLPAQWQEAIERFANGALMRFNSAMPDFMGIVKDFLRDEMCARTPAPSGDNTMKVTRELRALVESTISSILQSLDYLIDILNNTKWGGWLKKTIEVQRGALQQSAKLTGPFRSGASLRGEPEPDQLLLPYFQTAAQHVLMNYAQTKGIPLASLGPDCSVIPIPQLKLILGAIRGLQGKPKPTGMPLLRMPLPPVRHFNAAPQDILSVQNLVDFEELTHAKLKGAWKSPEKKCPVDPLAPKRGKPKGLARCAP